MILYALQGPAVEVENRSTWHAIQSRILDNDACKIRREENRAHASLQVVDYRRTPPMQREVFLKSWGQVLTPDHQRPVSTSWLCLRLREQCGVLY